MGLALRLTFKGKDYVFEIVSANTITKATTDLSLILNGEKILLLKDERGIWKQDDGNILLEPELIHALGRSVSLRFRI
ncbi:MAG: hypothetical protein JWQ25_367 [Daejeonella sp.]|nr:hypothetical protein [Daejeonella sp.]